MRTRILKTILAFTSLSVLATVIHWTDPAAGKGPQAKQRVVQIKTFKDQPVEITAIKVKDTVIEPGKKFAADSDWLNGMIVTVKNISDKPIIYITVTVGAYYEKVGGRKRTSDGRDILAAMDIGYGLRPPLPGEPARSYSAVPLMPGQTSDVVLSGLKRDELYSLLRQEDASTDISELKLWLDLVAWYGEEQRMWSNGRMLRQDPNDPLHWMLIEDSKPPMSPTVSPQFSLRKAKETR